MINFLVNKGTRMWHLNGNMDDENDRQVAITWLKQLKAVTPKDQFEVDKAIVALGGTPELPGAMTYDLFQQ